MGVCINFAIVCSGTIFLTSLEVDVTYEMVNTLYIYINK